MGNPQTAKKDEQKAAKDAKTLLSTADVAKLYGVSEETVRRWVRKGVIAYKQVGPFRLTRITLEEAKKHLKDVQGAAAGEQ